MITVDVDVPAGIDVLRTMKFQRFGPRDPCARAGASFFAKAFRFRGDEVVVRVTGGGERVRVDFFGDGAERVAPHARSMVGADDPAWDDASLPRVVRDGLVGTRLPRAPWITDRLTTQVMQQRVPFDEAARAWAMLCRRLGTKAPGDVDVIMPPPFRALARVSDHELRSVGIDMQRRITLRRVWEVAHRLDPMADEPREEALRKMATIRGIGPWTLGMMAGLAFGDADAAPTGDYALPHSVAFALAGEERADDARMLELLAPYAGNRFRVIKAISTAGIEAPRRGPKRELVRLDPFK